MNQERTVCGYPLAPVQSSLVQPQISGSVPDRPFLDIRSGHTDPLAQIRKADEEPEPA